MMEEFELFGIDPAERASALTPEEFAELQQLLAEEAILQTQLPASPPPAAMDFGAGEGFQGRGFKGEGIAQNYTMASDPSFASEYAMPEVMSPEPFTRPETFNFEAEAAARSGFQTPPSIEPNARYIMQAQAAEQAQHEAALAQQQQADALPFNPRLFEQEATIRAGEPRVMPGYMNPEDLARHVPATQGIDMGGMAAQAIEGAAHRERQKERLSTWDPVGSIEEGRAWAAGPILGAWEGAKKMVANAYQFAPEGSVYHSYGKNWEESIDKKLKIIEQSRRIWEEYGGSGIDPDGGWGMFSNRIIQSAVESLPVTGATAAASISMGLPVGLSSMFAVVFADSYGRNTAEGMDDALATEDAAVNAAFEVLTEIPFLRFLKGSGSVASKTVRERIKNTLKGAGYEGFGEAINSLLGNTYDAMRHGKEFGVNQLMEAWDSFLTGNLLGGGIASTQEAVTGAGRLVGDANVARRENIGFGDARRQRFDLATEGTIAERAVDEATQRGGFEEQNVDTDLARKLNAERELAALETGADPEVRAIEEARIDRNQGTVSFNPNDIREHLVNTFGDGVTQRQANEHLTGLLSHEAVAHGGLLKFFQTAGKGSPLDGAVGNLTDYMAKFRETNAKKIDAWLATPRGQLYADRDAQTQTEEYVAIQLAEGMTDGPMRGVLSKVKLMLTKATGFKYSEGEVIALMRNIRRQLEAGTMTQSPVEGAIGPTTPEGAKRAVLERGQVNLPVEPFLNAEAEIPLSSRQPGDPPLSGKGAQRRKFAGAAALAAAAPSLLTTPATAAEPTSTFAGGIMRPGVAPEMEGVLRAAAADAAPAGGLVTPQASEAFDDFDFDVAAQEDADLQARLDKYEADQKAQEEEKKVPQKWRELETEDLETLAEANRAKDNPIWQAQYKELESRKETSPPDLEAGSMEAYQQAVAERQAAQDKMDELLGGIDDAVMDTARSTDPTPKLVDQRVAEDTLFSKQAKDMNAQEKLGRDVGYDVSRFGYKTIVGQPDEVEIRGRLKRIQSLWGKPGQIREANPGTREFANELIDKAKNDPSGFEEAMAEFETVMAKKAQSRTLRGQQAARAKRLGVDISQLGQYRARDEIHPIERKMTYTMAQQQIDALENDGTIDSKEAENRRRAANTLNSELEGRLPPLAKRKLTDITYGVGTKFNVTESQKMDLEKEAEVARAKERTKRTRRVDPTAKQTEATTSALPTPAEKTTIEAMRGADGFGHLKTDKQRLRFLREKEAMPESERDALDAFMRNIRGWDEAAFKKQRDYEQRESYLDMIVDHDQFKIEQTPEQRNAELREMQRARQSYKEQRKIFQVEGGYYDTLAEGEMLSEQDEVLPEGFEIDEGTTLSSKRAKTPLTTTPKVGDTVGVAVGNGVARAIVVSRDKLPKPVKDEIKDEVGKGVTIPNRFVAYQFEGSDITQAGTVFYEPPVEYKNQKDRREAMRLTDAAYGKDPSIAKIQAEVTTLNSVLGKKSVEADHVVELLNIARDPHTGREYIDTGRLQHRGKNLAIVPIRIHKIKSDWVSNKIWSDGFSTTQSRQDSPSPYTDMLDWIRNTGDSAQVAAFLKKYPELGANGATLAAFKEQLIAGYTWGTPLQALVNGINMFEPGQVQLTKSQHAQLVKADENLSKSEVYESLAQQAVYMSRRPKAPKGVKGYSEHFNDHFWYRLTSFLWGKPVQAIRDFNKLSRFGQAKGSVPAADQIADEIQRAHSSTQRADELVYGTDMMQDTSLKSGEFFSELSKLFALMTGRTGAINTRNNKVLVDVLIGKTRVEELPDMKMRESAKGLQELVQKVYNYAKNETRHLDKPLDLRGHGDTLLPRVWNIEFLATRAGKAKFLRVIRNALTNPETGSSILDETDLTVDDLYDVVINSGGFVQGDWTNLKADQTRSQKDIDRDLKAQEYLDSLETEGLLDDGLVLDDLQAIIPRFIQKAVERTEYSKRFGINDELLRAKIKEALAQIGKHNAEVLKLNPSKEQAGYIDPKRFEKSVWDMARILRNKYGYDITNMNTRTWLQRLANIQVIAKLPLVTLASMPELFTPMLRGSVNPAAWSVDLMAGMAWAGYKAMNGISKLMFNTHLPAMRKASGDIGGLGIIRDVQMLREMGIAEIQAMGDLVSTRYANPNFARGGLRAGARGTIAGKIPKQVRSVFNMQVYMQATMLTTLTEMQQLMAMRNFQRHMARRVKFVNKNKDKTLKGRKLRLFNQFKQDMADFGMDMDINLDTSKGEAEFNAGALRFIDQVITRPNDATTAKAFKNPLTAPIFLFKRFITTFGNTLMTAVGNDMANKVSNVEQAKQAGKILVAMTTMYGAVMFAEIIRGAIKGDLDEDDATITGGDFRSFVRRLDRTGLLSAPGAMAVNLAFPYKRGWWDTPEARLVGELGGPILGDITEIMGQATDPKDDSFGRLVRQIMPLSKKVIPANYKKKSKSLSSGNIGYSFGDTSESKKSGGYSF